MSKGNDPKSSKEQSSRLGIKDHRYDMHYGASNLIFKKAEELRKFPTHEEDIIWGYLCKNQLGIKFRRQHPVSLYIADF